ncbi:MAG: thioredoxin family protein [Sporocytophaga sp.]|uniref:thioredoxin family protein n=1 Tax=Sporocytophaga sp. TaxID=2231183 RepID=UPI001AFD9B35|nr:thioredoxin family protein [Sporocytophaga sp.]MBO9699076.1 thioredoxin family protein [Sporocytophaga sp.]
MKKLIPLLTLVCLSINFIFLKGPWLTNFNEAQTEAKSSGKKILLYFSGSDWCSICAKMKKNLLETTEFKNYSERNLILVLADFPRMKKNRLDEAIVKQNEMLAEKYNKSGEFPHVILLDSEGKVLKEWSGYTGASPSEFIDQIEKVK